MPRLLLIAALPLLALAEMTSLSEAEAFEMFAEFDVVVDVRSEAAYRERHVAGAVLHSQTNLEGCSQRKVAFYCSGRSASDRTRTP